MFIQESSGVTKMFRKKIENTKSLKTYSKVSNENNNKSNKKLGSYKVNPLLPRKAVKFDELFLVKNGEELTFSPELKKARKKNLQNSKKFKTDSSSDSFPSANDTFDAIAKINIKGTNHFLSKDQHDASASTSTSNSSHSDLFYSPSVSLDMFTHSPVLSKYKKKDKVLTPKSTNNLLPVNKTIITSTPAGDQQDHRKVSLRNRDVLPSALSPVLQDTSILEISRCSVYSSFRMDFKTGKDWRRSCRSVSRKFFPQLHQLEEGNDASILQTTGEASFLSCADPEPALESDAKTFVLKLCLQSAEIDIISIFGERLDDCIKIGEGIYGEVFVCHFSSSDDKKSVLKIIPIEGDFYVNDERQKKFEEIAAEIVVSKALSDLWDDGNESYTTSFAKISNCWCVKGSYPTELLRLWDEYHERKTSENDRPDFPESQLYIVLESGFAGRDLEAFVFNNATQAYAAFLQVAYALAVAESVLEFEHRDLHWGNVLISNTTSTFIYSKFNGRKFKLETCGVKATVIDFTLSRLCVDGRTYFNDLSTDPTLFCGEGDYQFEVYRKMQMNNENNWETFRPKSNVYWLHYLSLKMMDHCYFKNKSTKIHREGITKLKNVYKSIEDFGSASAFVNFMENKIVS